MSTTPVSESDCQVPEPSVQAPTELPSVAVPPIDPAQLPTGDYELVRPFDAPILCGSHRTGYRLTFAKKGEKTRRQVVQIVPGAVQDVKHEFPIDTIITGTAGEILEEVNQAREIVDLGYQFRYSVVCELPADEGYVVRIFYLDPSDRLDHIPIYLGNCTFSLARRIREAIDHYLEDPAILQEFLGAREELAELTARYLRSEIPDTVIQFQLTPPRALAFLELNTWNRDVQDAAIEDLAETMSKGMWTRCIDGLGLLRDHKLGNGQHRCMACVLSGRTTQYTLALGLTEEDLKNTEDRKSVV
jgi:hypothetical protein